MYLLQTRDVLAVLPSFILNRFIRIECKGDETSPYKNS